MAEATLNPDRPRFSVETAGLGRIDAFRLTYSRMKTLDSINRDTPQRFMNKLVAAIGRKADGAGLTLEECAALTDDERDEFAARFLEDNDYLYRERLQDERKDEDGSTVISIRHGDIKHPKSEEESDSAYLLRLFTILEDDKQEQVLQIMKPYETILKAHKRLFPPPFVEAFKTSQSLSSQLGETIKRLQTDQPNLSKFAGTTSAWDQLKLPMTEQPTVRSTKLPIVRNPVHDTNFQLSEVADRLESMDGLAVQMAETVKGVSDSVSQFLVAFGVASDNADRTSRRAIRIAFVAIIFAVLCALLQIGYAEWRAERDQASTAAAIKEVTRQIKAVGEVQRKNLAHVSIQMGRGNDAVKDSFDRLTATIEALQKLIDDQNRPARSPTQEN